MNFSPSSQYPSFSMISTPNYEFKGSSPSTSNTKTRSSNAKRHCHRSLRKMLPKKGQKFTASRAAPLSDPCIDILSEKLLKTLIHGVSKDGVSVIDSKICPTENISKKGQDSMFNVEYLRPRWTRSFRPFPKLPVELRMSIWQLALPKTRVLTIKRKQYTRVSGSGSAKLNGFAAPGKSMLYLQTIIIQQLMWITAQVPTILHVNREARSEALRYYQLSFGGCGAPATIYFDPRFDTVYFRSNYMRAIDLLAFLAGASNANTITSIAITGTYALMSALSIALEEDEWCLREMAKKNLMALQTAMSISTHDPKVLTQDVQIKSCAHNNLILDSAKRKIIEEFLGVKLRCAHVMWAME